MVRLLLAWMLILWALPAKAAEQSLWPTCKPAYCSLALTTELAQTNNIGRNGKHEDAPVANTQVELRADVVPIAYGVYTNLSIQAILSDRLDDPGNNLGILIPQAFFWKKAFGLQWSVSYSPVFIFREEFQRNTARLHAFNFGVKHIWKTPPFLLDELDLRFEFKEIIAEPDASSEHRLTLESEMAEHFHVNGFKFRLWSELRAETGIRNQERRGTRIAHKFTGTLKLTTDLTDNLRLTVLKIKRIDQASGPRTSDFGRWEIGTGLRLKFNW